jgi:hypothetical protein
VYLIKEEVVVGVYSIAGVLLTKGSGSFNRDLPEEFFLRCFLSFVLA